MSIQSELLAAPQVPLRYLVRFNPRPTAINGDESCYLPMEAISEFGAVDSSRMRPTAELAQGYSFVADGDVAYAKVTPCFENGKGLRAAGLPRGHAFATTEITVMRPSSRLDSRYLAWVLQSEEFRAPGEAHMSGAGGLKRVPESYAARYRIPHPSTAVQRAIADYLDRETAQIDAFIAKNEELITLLTERRAAVTARAVTRGINPEAQMKSSGIPWLESIPIDWQAVRVKFAADSVPGFAFASADFVPGGDATRLLRGINVGIGEISWGDVVSIMSPPASIVRRYSLRDGDLVLGMDRPVIRGGLRVARVEGSSEGALLVQRVLRLRGRAVRNDFLEYSMAWGGFAMYIEPDFTGVSVPHMSEQQVGNFTIALPDLETQRRIVAHIREQHSRIDDAIGAARRSVGLARERRSALISAVVTGKIDVGVAA